LSFPPFSFFYTMEILKKYFNLLFACLFLCPHLVFYVCAEPVIPEKPGVNDTQVTLLDNTHKFVVKSMYGPVAWFDNFFSDERTLDEGPASSSLRWRKELRWEEGGNYSLFTFFHANVRLPKASKKLKLIVTGDEDEEPAELIPGELAEPGFIKSKERERINMGLRYNLIYTMVSKLHFGSGIKLKRPLEPYVRARYRHIIPVAAAAQVRFTGTALWRNLKGWKETAQLDFEKLFSESMLIRWSNSVIFEDPDIDYAWSSSLGFQHLISKQYALSYTAGMSGTDMEIMSYNTVIRFRSSFYREWLFYEIAPEISWPRDKTGNYNAVPAISFRIEMQFQ